MLLVMMRAAGMYRVLMLWSVREGSFDVFECQVQRSAEREEVGWDGKQRQRTPPPQPRLRLSVWCGDNV